jgi:hypothetical protein
MTRVCVPIKSESDANQVVSVLTSFGFSTDFPDEVAKNGGYVCVWSHGEYSLDREQPECWASEYVKPNQLAERLQEL